MIQMTLVTNQKETHSLRKPIYGCGRMGEGIVREFGKVMYTLLYSKQITSKVVPIVGHMELYSMLPASLDGRGVGGEWIQVYVPLSPFAVHLPQLLIGYSPIQNKKFKKQRLYGN